MRNKGWDASWNGSSSLEVTVDESDKMEADEATALTGNRQIRNLSTTSIPETEAAPFEALKEMFTENKINVLLVFLPLAYISHSYRWNDASIFVLNFLAMVPLASMLGSELTMFKEYYVHASLFSLL